MDVHLAVCLWGVMKTKAMVNSYWDISSKMIMDDQGRDIVSHLMGFMIDYSVVPQIHSRINESRLSYFSHMDFFGSDLGAHKWRGRVGY